MKKTIAKIMAAAMVLSTVATSNVAFAATLPNGVTTSIAAHRNISINGTEIVSDGDNTGDAFNYDMSAAELKDLLTISSGNYTVDDYAADYPVTASVWTDGDADEITDASVTSATASSARKTPITDESDIVKLVNYTGSTNKITVGNEGEFQDLHTADVAPLEWVTANAWVNGDTNVADLRLNINANYNYHNYLMSQIANGSRIRLRVALVNAAGADTGVRCVINLGAPTSDNNDDYWNAIVKLKADNNRYTPIRVHVDAVDGSLAGNNFGLYVQVVNGTIIPWTVDGTRTWAGTTNLLVNSTGDLKLVLNDVQTDDLAILKSDLAKGKRLLLDEAFLFDVTDVVNNNGLNAAGPQYYDFGTLGENTDLGTVSIGKITDIRSRLFKDGKEKLVQAKNVKFIRNGAFRKNKQLKKAILSDDVSMKKINEKAFYDCKKLNTVKVKVKTLKQVGKNAFGGSTDKKGLKFNLDAGNKTQYNKAVKLFKKSGVKKAKFRKI